MMIRVGGVSLSLVASVAMLATALFAVSARAQECGEQAGGALCSDCRCCSRWGWCGTGPAYCTEGCQSQCDGCSGGGGGDDVTSVVSRPVFDKMLKHRNDVLCPARGFYTYDAFVAAADTFAFDGFGTTGDVDTRKREVAAFLAQTAHETAGGWPFAPDGPYAWGYCFKEEAGAAAFGRDYCDRSHSAEWPCAAGKKYYGRGPFQLTWNYNYGLAGEFLGVDLLDDPDVLTKDAVVSFETAIWYWMTPRPPKPSSHDVITGKWTPSEADLNAGRVPGYGAVTNVIAGERECGRGLNKFVADRIGFYKRFCDMLGVSYGDNLDCFDQAPFGSAIALTKTTNVTNHANA